MSKISEYDPITPTSDDYVPIVDAGTSTTKRATIANVLSIAPGAASGTDVAVADGGTGASTAAAARTNLGVQSKTFVTVGSSNADYVTTDYASDNLAVQAAVNVLPATGGRLLMKNTTYNFTARVDIIGKSNIVIAGESQEGAIIKAANSLYVSGADHHLGMFNVRSHTGAIRDITFRNLTLDCNNRAKTQALTITGGTTEGVASTKKVLLEHVTFKNMGENQADTSRGHLEVIAGNMFFGNYGKIDDFKIYNCEFDTSQHYAIYWLGNYITNVQVKNCYFHEIQTHSVNIYQYGFQDGKSSMPRTNRNWEVAYNRFERTKLRVTGSSVVDIEDDNRTGIKNLHVHHNYFGPTVNPGNDEYAVDTHGSWGLQVDHNFFDQVNHAVSIGQSLSGAYYKIEPDMFVDISNNYFYKVQGSCFDHDSGMFQKFSNNYFIECGAWAFSGYSRHWPTIYEDNFIYNCATDPVDASEYRKAGIEIVGDGYIVRGNVIIDDRKLPDPTTAPSLNQVAGGALGARTYYVKYTWANDTGETLASSQATLAVSANNLLKITMPTAAYPSGAKKINLYIDTISGSETLQDYIGVAYQTEDGEQLWSTLAWTEPTTGLVAGAALPGSNTTTTKMKYGIYETSGHSGFQFANHYYDNHFYGMDEGNEIFKSSTYTRVQRNNFSNPTLIAGNEQSVEARPYAQGNVTGATTFNVANNENISATLTGNITVTLSNGQYKGQLLQLNLTQDGTGSRTVTWPSNFKKAGGTLTLSTGIGAVDVIEMAYDGTNWREVSRALDLS